jgi:NADH-quinone oxidoreductase chain G
MADTVTLTIDDKQVTVPAGTLVVDAARAAGIEIPVFCSHPRLDPVGVCRMCLVEYAGPRGNRLDVSCTVPVTEGMVVRTNTAPVIKAREAVLGFLLINHPLDCPICDKGGECPLQDQTMQYGPGLSQFVEPKRHKLKHYPVSDLIMLDQERCVLCWRCIRYLEEWEDKPQLGLFQRGDRTIIDTFPGQPVDAKTSGSVIDICPVGALTDRTARFHFRPWELKMTPSICTHCAVGCNLRLDERVHQLRRIVARDNPEVNDFWICDKGRFLYQFVDDNEQRIKTPMVRDNGSLREASWTDALDRIVERLTNIQDTKGANRIGGIAAGRVSNEASYLFQKFFRTMVGSNNVDFPTGSAVRALPSGLPAIADVIKSDLIVLVGVDAGETAPVLDLFIKRAVRRGGARLLVINSRRIENARYPGAFLPVRPGNESSLINGLSAALLSRRDTGQGKRPAAQSGRDSAPAQAASAQAVPAQAARAQANAPAKPASTDEASRVRAYTPERVQAETGVPLAALGQAVDMLTSAKRPLFLYGPEAATGERGGAAVQALMTLTSLLGQAAQLGYVPSEANSQGLRDVGLLPDMLPGQVAIGEAAVRERLGKLWGVQPPAEPGLSYQQMLNGGVAALYVAGGNPAAVPAVAEALRKLDFLVVQELYLNETAQLADVVLPATSWAEADGTYTNMERRVQRGNASVRSVGESLPDWQIFTMLAERWQASSAPAAGGAPVAEQAVAAGDGSDPDWKRKRRRVAAARQGPVAKAWNYTSAGAVLEEIGRAVPYYSTFHWETLGQLGQQWPANSLARSLRRPESLDVPAVPIAPQGSYWLASAPVLWNAGTLMQQAHERLKLRIPGPFVALNHSDLGMAGLTEGSQVTVTSPYGKVLLTLCADTAVQPGTAWIPLDLAGKPAESLGAGRGEPIAVTIAA